MPKHKHAQHMLAASQDAKIQWQFDRGNGEWRDVRKPKWYEEFEYRQKPQETAGIHLPQRYVSGDGPSRDDEFNRASYEKGWNDAILEMSRLNEERRVANLESLDQISDAERISYLRSLNASEIQQLFGTYDGTHFGEFNQRLDAAIAPLRQPGLDTRLGAQVRKSMRQAALQNGISTFSCGFEFSVEASSETEAIAKALDQLQKTDNH